MATRFLYDSAWALGAATASSSDVAFSPDSTRNNIRGFPWRSASSSVDVWLANNFGSAKSVSGVALINPLVSGLVVTVKVQKSTDGLTWTDVTGGAISQTTERTNLWMVWFPSTTTQFLRILFTRVSGTGYVQVGTVMAGAYFEPTYSINVNGFNIERADLSTITKGRSGMISRSIYSQYERFPLNFEQMPSADGQAFRTMFSTVGVGGHLIVTIDETTVYYTWYGYFEASMVTPATEMPDQFDIQLKFCEAL